MNHRRHLAEFRAHSVILDKGYGSESHAVRSCINQLSYEDIRTYLQLLLKQSESNPQQVQIDRTVIDPNRIRAVEHSKLAGLQVADAVASGFHFALKVNRYGETETGYLPHLKKTIYRHKGVAMGYGLKLWPGDLATVKNKAPRGDHPRGLVKSDGPRNRGSHPFGLPLVRATSTFPALASGKMPSYKLLVKPTISAISCKSL